MNRYVFITILLTAWLIPASGAFADKLPKHYPESFNNIGLVDGLHPGYIVIDDVEFLVSPATRVYTPHSRFSSLRALKKGMRVGYAAEHKGNEIGQVTEVWVLPKGFGREERGE